MTRLLLPARRDGVWERVEGRREGIQIYADNGAAVDFTMWEVEQVLIPLIEQRLQNRLEWSDVIGRFNSAISGPQTNLYFEAYGQQQRIDMAWLKLVIDTAWELLYAQRRRAIEPDAAILDSFPAQELLVVIQKNQLAQWRRLWESAGGRLYDGRMIAFKWDPVWWRIGRLGHCHSPFDFDSGMDVEDVGRQESMDLGFADSAPPSLSSCDGCEQP